MSAGDDKALKVGNLVDFHFHLLTLPQFMPSIGCFYVYIVLSLLATKKHLLLYALQRVGFR